MIDIKGLTDAQVAARFTFSTRVKSRDIAYLAALKSLIGDTYVDMLISAHFSDGVEEFEKKTGISARSGKHVLPILYTLLSVAHAGKECDEDMIG